MVRAKEIRGNKMSYKCEGHSCSYCNMMSKSNSSVLRHERDFCRKNPNRKNCWNCKHFEWDKSDTDDSPYCLFKEDYTDYSPNENNKCEDFRSK